MKNKRSRKKSEQWTNEANEAGFEGLKNALARYTVALVPETGWAQGSGVGIAFKGQYFVATAAHVIQDFRDAHQVIYLMAKPPGPLAKDPRDVRLNPRFRPPIKDIVISQHIADDIALIRLAERPTELPEDYFFGVNAQEPIPSLSKTVMLFGFPIETARPVAHKGIMAGASLPHFDVLPIAKVDIKTIKFLKTRGHNPALHFLMRFPKVAPDSGMLSHPGGLSGAGVWMAEKLQSQVVWSPDNLRLVGIQIRQNADKEVLVATRIKRLWRLL